MHGVDDDLVDLRAYLYVLQVLDTEIYHFYVQCLFYDVVDIGGYAYPSRLRDGLYPAGYVHAVTEHVVVGQKNVSDVNADPYFDIRPGMILEVNFRSGVESWIGLC